MPIFNDEQHVTCCKELLSLLATNYPVTNGANTTVPKANKENDSPLELESFLNSLPAWSEESKPEEKFIFILASYINLIQEGTSFESTWHYLLTTADSAGRIEFDDLKDIVFTLLSFSLEIHNDQTTLFSTWPTEKKTAIFEQCKEISRAMLLFFQKAILIGEKSLLNEEKENYIKKINTFLERAHLLLEQRGAELALIYMLTYGHGICFRFNTDKKDTAAYQIFIRLNPAEITRRIEELSSLLARIQNDSSYSIEGCKHILGEMITSFKNALKHYTPLLKITQEGVHLCYSEYNKIKEKATPEIKEGYIEKINAFLEKARPFLDDTAIGFLYALAYYIKLNEEEAIS